MNSNEIKNENGNINHQDIDNDNDMSASQQLISLVNSQIEEQQAVDQPDEDIKFFNLEMIPTTIDNINQNLVRFTGYMLESYDVEEKDLPLL